MEQVTLTNDIVGLLRAVRRHPELLNEEQRKAISSMALLLDGAEKIIEEANQKELDEKWREWTQTWLNSFTSLHTRVTFERQLRYFEGWCVRTKKSPTRMTYMDAEAFALSNEVRLKKSGEEKSPRAIRCTIEAISSLYSAVQRYSEGRIYNPFKGIKAKPKNRAKKEVLVPSQAEVETIMSNTTGIIKAAIAVMAFRGFRIGALPGLELTTRDGITTFKTLTKGREQVGQIPNQVIDAIKDAGLSRKAPFKNINNVNTFNAQIRRALKKLWKQGLIKNDYSPHSFRHYFAITFYTQTKDIERLRRLLNHEYLNITQIYLQSLNVIL